MWRLWSLLLWCCSTLVSAEDKLPIILGMSAPFSGPAAQLGLSYRHGAELVFQKQNQLGGIAGRPLQLVALDDGYEPLRTVANTRQLLFSHQVMALFGYIGTPTSSAVLPMLRHEQVPYLAPFSGADLLRQSEDHFIYNFRASYAEEAKAQIAYLVDKQKLRKVALLIQADEFGATLEQSFLTELSYRGIKPLVISRFQRNSGDLSLAVKQLVQYQPELVLTVGTYQVLAQAIKLANLKKFRPMYSVVSFTGVSELALMLSSQDKVVASMVMPDPLSSPLALAKAYRKAAGDKVPLTDIAFEGFAAATLLVQALQQCSEDISRSCLLKTLPAQKLYDFELNYDQKRHQASTQVFLVRLKNQQLQPLSVND
ncbi:ABC transporter substrate-binding protein [Rheinheimera sp. 4Y26]|uniref:ABC transporter substrate-binding protein n=1 Tax=Rheinheimera sp. 4Y26 TaxID=2977811 RepID=UPI0021B14168|nr:ABC transporter substrate-binding protein [Rheinheimera sp. 4Y26]MCT6698220.1 ABC transporter substrate-binding protein [Rheinheimera sp. 4Y26]